MYGTILFIPKCISKAFQFSKALFILNISRNKKSFV